MTENDTEPVGTPRWVKAFVAIALASIVLIIVVLIVGRGHGPGRHALGVDGSRDHAGLPLGVMQRQRR